MADETKKPDQEPAPATEAGAGAKSPASESAGAETTAADVATLEGRIADLTDRLLRAHAEMDNMR